MIIGKGKIKKDDKEVVYVGTLPRAEEGEEVVVIRIKDVKEVLEDKIQLLLTTAKPMPKELYSSIPIKDEKGKEIGAMAPFFPDFWTLVAKDRTQHKLYLDRNFYTNNSKDMIFIRYVSMDKAFIEESEVFESDSK